MWYLSALILGVVAIATWFFFKSLTPAKTLDVNNDGKVDTADVKAVADVNKDGKVDVVDAKVAVVEVVAEVKEAVVAPVAKAATKAKKTVEKTVAKKATAKSTKVKK